MDPCIICEGIAERTQPVATPIYPLVILDETELTLSILTDRQLEVGHALVVTKRHASTLFDLTDAEFLAVTEAARRLAKGLVAALDPNGILIYQNNGVWAGQSTPHFHLHVVPRQPESNWGVGPPHLASLEERRRQPLPPAPSLEERIKTGDLIRGKLGNMDMSLHRRDAV
jgi:diadenosine tetraphosphate (Ap4A) HIT family hydrolase